MTIIYCTPPLHAVLYKHKHKAKRRSHNVNLYTLHH
nr:MAG TPA: hypothetical protein [Caudoviricetes sp.]